jgi:protease PrsW
VNNSTLFSLTRRSSFLWKATLALIFGFFALGTVLSWLNPNPGISYHDIFESPDYYETGDENPDLINYSILNDKLIQALNGPDPFENKLIDLEVLLSFSAFGKTITLPEAAEVPNLSASEYAVATAYAEAKRITLDETKAATEATAQLLQPLLLLAESQPPVPYANYALALHYQNESKYMLAIAAVQSELAISQIDAAKELLIYLYFHQEDYERIEQLQTDPEYAPFIDSALLQDIALERMDWPALFTTLIPAAYANAQASMVFLALLTGIIWSAFLIRLNDAPAHLNFLLKLAIPALILGALSAHLTILVIFLQEHQLGLTEGDTLITQVIYCVAGIGMREELLKLLCFVPLLPFVLKRNDDRVTFIVASLVGLGFAVEENLNYFEMSQGISTLGRFVTANFLHLSLTGLCGLALTRAVKHGGYYINQVVNTVGLAIIAHGAYDAFIIVPELVEYGMLTSIVFILIVYRYFAEARALRRTWSSPFSMTAQLTFSLVTIIGTSFIIVAWSSGAMLGLITIASEVISVGVLLVLFYREIPEAIH